MLNARLQIVGGSVGIELALTTITLAFAVCSFSMSFILKKFVNSSTIIILNKLTQNSLYIVIATEQLVNYVE